jgi:hypothetical protein
LKFIIVFAFFLSGEQDYTTQLPSDTLINSSVQATQDNESQNSRITPGVPSEYDWIKLVNGKEKEVEIRRISEKYVYFSEPREMDMKWIDRREVQTLYYRSGKIEQMTQGEVEIRKVKDWKLVELTKDISKVESMIRIDVVEIRLEASSRHHYYKPETLQSSAEIVLKKNAALLHADIILITRTEHHRAYGDPPSIYMSGVAYRSR